MENFGKNINNKILVVGDVMIDIYCRGSVDRISPEAPVPVLNQKNSSMKKVAGGAANVALNLKAADAEVYVFAVVGDDLEGEELRELLHSEEIVTKWICIDNSRPTTTKLRYIGQNNQQILRVDKESTTPISMEKVEKVWSEIENSISDFSAILMSDYLKGFLTDDICKKIISLANEYDIPIIIDVKDKNYSKYRNATLLKPNRNELRMLTGMPVDDLKQVEEAAYYLLNVTNVYYVLTTLGAEGMLIVEKGGNVKHIQSRAKDVYDVTGAGDTSIAYLTIEMARKKPISVAIEIANYAAGIQVSKVGTSVVYPCEVKQVMQKESSRDSALEAKICELAQLKLEIEYRKKHGEKIVFTNGCFDILHAGHVEYLHKAKQLGNCLIVGLNTDASIKRLKGESRPINCLKDRALVLCGLASVDYVVVFDEDTPIGLIKALCPDVLVKGGDYIKDTIVGSDFVEKNGGQVVTIPLVEGKSTTNLISKINS